MEEEREMQVEKEEEMDRWKRRRRGIAGRGEEDGKVEEERGGKKWSKGEKEKTKR